MSEIRLTVNFKIDMNGVSQDYIRENLASIIENAIANGQVTFDSDAELENYDIIVEDNEGEHLYEAAQQQ